ncbi:MAG TPA: DUF4190 domain-containing protein [Polyangia bacterium]|nr:DUF4190 domain-containing protein [Polyangia bacterium]
MDQPPPLSSPPAPPLRTSGLAIFALVMSCLFFIPFAPLIGLVLGIVALVRARPGQPRAVAIAAVAVGPVSFFFLQAMCAAVAIPAFMKYVRRSKTVEATLNVRRLADDANVYYVDNAKLPPAVDWTPAGEPCGNGRPTFAVDPAAWQRSPWSELHFSLDAPHHYQYRIVSEAPDRIAIEARGDLDCDGEFSLFRREVTPGGAGPLQIERELE